MLKNKYLTKFVLFILFLVFIFEIISVSTLFFSWYYVEQVSLGNEVGQLFSNWIELYGDFIDRAHRLSSFILGIALLFWLYKAHSNLKILGATNLRYSDASCVWWFFVQFANLWKPYSALKETLRESYRLANKELSNMGIVLLLWWLIQFPSTIISKLLSKAGEAYSLGQYIFILTAHILSYGLDIVLSIFLFLIITRIHRCQNIAFNSKSTITLQKH